MRRSLPLLATLAAEVSAVVLLYRFIREPGFAVPIALGFAAWLLGSTLLYLGTSLTRVPSAIHAAGRVTLPVLRRRVDRALAVSLLTGAVLAGAAPAFGASPLAADPVVDASAAPSESDEPPAVPSDPGPDPGSDPAPVRDERAPAREGPPTANLPVRTGRAGDPAAVTKVSTTREPPVDTQPLPPVDTHRVPPAPDPAPSPVVPAPATSPVGPVAPVVPVPAAAPAINAPAYTVVAGDNLWEIAARHLATETGRELGTLSASDVVGYWVRVCDANRDRIRSGDVNLIDPGEIIELPAV